MPNFKSQHQSSAENFQLEVYNIASTKTEQSPPPKDFVPGTQFLQIVLICSFELAKCSNHTKFQVFWLSQS